MNKQLPEYQTQLALIQHTVEDNPIDQRAIDGYINATAMCQVAGKRLANYTRLDTTRAPRSTAPTTEVLFLEPRPRLLFRFL